VTERELLDLIARARDEEWEELDLAGLDLEVLPPEIGSLVKLKRLILGKFDREKFGVAELMYDVAIETHKQYSKQGGIFCYINS
jgi:hypothetical protein